MATIADNVLVGQIGTAQVAPVGTTAPTLATTAWGTGWLDLGYINEDGIKEAHDDDTVQIPAWQRGDIVRNIIKGSAATYMLTLLETTKAALELYHKGSLVTGINAAGHGTASMSVASPTVDKRAFGFDVVDGAKLVRFVIPNGEVIERGEITYKNDEALSYELTVRAYPASNGIHTIKYFSDLAGLPVA